MSLPKFPTISPPITMNESLNMILASIAMEELGLRYRQVEFLFQHTTALVPLNSCLLCNHLLQSR